MLDMDRATVTASELTNPRTPVVVQYIGQLRDISKEI